MRISCASNLYEETLYPWAVVLTALIPVGLPFTALVLLAYNRNALAAGGGRTDPGSGGGSFTSSVGDDGDGDGNNEQSGDGNNEQSGGGDGGSGGAPTITEDDNEPVVQRELATQRRVTRRASALMGNVLDHVDPSIQIGEKFVHLTADYLLLSLHCVLM